MNSDAASGRLLWNHPTAIAFFAVSALVTVGVIAIQMVLRQGTFDPKSVPIFYGLFLFRDYPASLLLVFVLILGLVPIFQRSGVALVRVLGARPVSVAVGFGCALAAGAYWVYEARPLAMDESAPYMQSAIFAHGALVGRLPPDLLDWLIYPPFQGYFIEVSRHTGQIASSYWPGFALLLTPFMALGVPWLCNPVLGAMSIWAIHRLTLELTDSLEAAGAAILFSVASTAFVVNSISFYSMTAHLLCNVVFTLMLLRPSVGRCLLAGSVGGLALNLHNPVPHMLFAVPWLVWLVASADRRRFVPAIAVGYLPWVALGFAWHDMLQGLDPRVTGAVSGTPVSYFSVALAAMRGAFEVPGPQQLADRAIGLAKLWLWASAALLPLAGVGFWRHRRNTHYLLLLLSATVTLVGYLCVPLSQGHGWGYRYFHSVWFVLPVFAASAVTRPSDLSARIDALRPDPPCSYTFGAAVGSLLLLIPFTLWNVSDFIQEHLGQLPSADHGRARVVIINPMAGYYAQDLVQNDPFLREPVIYMVTHGRTEDRQMLARYFPDLVLLSHDGRGTVWGYLDGRDAEGVLRGLE